MRIQTRHLMAPAALIAIASLAACGGGGGAADDGEIHLVQEGKLTVCTNPPYAPFEDTVDGEIVGFDMAITGEVAKDLGVELNPRSAPFEGLQSGMSLNAGECDIAASGITITPERQEKIDFADSYFDSTQGLLVRADSGIKELVDLTGKPVAVQQATTGETWAEDQPEIDSIKQYEDLGLQMSGLKAGDVVAVLNDIATLTPYIDDTYIVSNDFSTGEQYGVAVKKGNTALRDQINTTLERIRSDGTYDALYAEWIGAQPEE
jgi:polar amino acid transport system substrate-binding protein